MMSLTFQESFDRSCRLCAEEQDVTIMIFSAQAKAMLLQNKLNKYLLIEIEEDDKLPKNICIQCCTKLHTVCDFIDTARKAQEILLNRSILLEQVTCDVPHSMHINPEIKSEPIEYYDDEQSYVTEMEVSVDPMMVLQNSDGSPSPIQEDINRNEIEDDLSYLHGLEGEDVTIKLIRKGDQQTGSLELLEETKKFDISQSFLNYDLLTKPFPCKVCKRGFLTELALKNHSWIHSGGGSNEDKNNKLFRCHTCDEGFDYRCDLVAHAKEHRTSSTCKKCGRIFRSERNLEVHMASHASPFASHVCKICGRSYNSKSNLKTHSITHSNDRPFKCSMCKKSFKRNQDLKFHINQHTGAKPYKCPFCDKSFASSGNCYSHRSRMHPGRRMETKVTRGMRKMREPINSSKIKPLPLPTRKPVMTSHGAVYRYQCTMCENTFNRRDNLTYHMYQHTGEKPFHCTVCPEKFITRRGLLLHHNKDHPGKGRPLALISKNVLLK